MIWIIYEVVLYLLLLVIDAVDDDDVVRRNSSGGIDDGGGGVDGDGIITYSDDCTELAGDDGVIYPGG